MARTSVLLVGTEADVVCAREVLDLAADVRLDVLATTNTNRVLDVLVTSKPNLCFLCDGDRTAWRAETVLAGLQEAGLSIATVVVLAAADPCRTRLLRRRGAFAVADDVNLAIVMPYLLSMAADRRRTMIAHRKEMETLIKQLFDLRDEQERMDEQSARLVAMAEELNFSKEALQRLNQEKNRLFSLVAHDLRSPFNAILGFSQMLARMAEQLTPAQTKGYAENVHAAAGNVFKLMETLLEWARLQMDQIACEPCVVDLSALVDRTLQVYRPIAQRKGIDLLSTVGGDAAYCDAGTIETVIRNLVDNAVKFTGAGGRVEIGMRVAGGKLRVFVSDTGVGMSPEQVARCFNIADGTRTNGTGGERGNGLGLLLCKGLVEKNTGELGVVSRLGEGSCFSFTLQRPAPALAGVAEACLPAQVASGSFPLQA